MDISGKKVCDFTEFIVESSRSRIILNKMKGK